MANGKISVLDENNTHRTVEAVRMESALRDGRTFKCPERFAVNQGGGAAAAVGDEEEEPGARVAGLGVDVRRGGGAEWGGGGGAASGWRSGAIGTARAREWD